MERGGIGARIARPGRHCDPLTTRFLHIVCEGRLSEIQKTFALGRQSGFAVPAFTLEGDERGGETFTA